MKGVPELDLVIKCTIHIYLQDGINHFASLDAFLARKFGTKILVLLSQCARCTGLYFVVCIHLGSWAKFNDTWEIGAERDFQDLHYELTFADSKPENSGSLSNTWVPSFKDLRRWVFRNH